MPNFENKLIEVCGVCRRATCRHGEFLCLDSKQAGTVLRTVSELRKLDFEHESHWRDDNLKEIYGEPAPHGYFNGKDGEDDTDVLGTDWIVRIHGPDDITGPYTEIDALKKANEINTVYIREYMAHGPDKTPMCIATVKYINDNSGPVLGEGK